LRIQLLSQGTSAFLSLDTQSSLTVGNIALKKEHGHLETSVRNNQQAWKKSKPNPKEKSQQDHKPKMSKESKEEKGHQSFCRHGQC
jgi:hypothetical protein